MSEKNPFFTFPLPILAMKLDEKEKLRHMLASALERAGDGAQGRDLDKTRVNLYVAEGKAPGFTTHSGPHEILVRGAILCNVTFGSVQATYNNSCDAALFVSAQEAKWGGSPLVMVSSSLFWGCHNENDPSYRDFTTLCAVNSIIGFNHKPVLIRRTMVLARQLGYKTPAVMQAELRARKDQVPLTTQQLRDTLDRLETAGLLARYQASRTRVYFSTFLPYDDLKAAVEILKTKQNRVFIRRQQEIENRTGTNKKPSENHLKRKQPKSPEKEPLKKKEPTENHNGTTNGTKQEPQTEPLKEVSSKKCLQTTVSKQERNTKLPASPKPAQREDGEIQPGQEKQSLNGHPTKDEVEQRGHRIGAFPLRVASYFAQMEETGWKDADGKPLVDWRPAFDAAMRHAKGRSV